MSKFRAVETMSGWEIYRYEAETREELAEKILDAMKDTAAIKETSTWEVFETKMVETETKINFDIGLIWRD